MANLRVLLSSLLLFTISMRLRVSHAKPDYYYDDYDDVLDLESELQEEANSVGVPQPEVNPIQAEQPTEGDALQVEGPTEEAAIQAEGPTEGDAVGPEVELRQQATQNTNVLKKLADVMSTLLTETANRRCLDTSSTTQQLTGTIQEGFNVLVGAINNLNTTLHHYKAEISKKAFGNTEAEVFENDGPCPSPFLLVGEDCLYIETEHLRFFDAARQACIDMGAKLAEFSTFDHFIAAVSDMDMHEEAEIYLGGTDEESEGDWRWLSGGRIENLSWGPDEPSNSDAREHCLAFSYSRRNFNDIPCTFRREYACVKK